MCDTLSSPELGSGNIKENTHISNQWWLVALNTTSHSTITAWFAFTTYLSSYLIYLVRTYLGSSYWSTPMSAEIVIGIIGLLVALPPSLLVIWRTIRPIKQRRANLRDSCEISSPFSFLHFFCRQMLDIWCIRYCRPKNTACLQKQRPWHLIAVKYW